MEHIIRDYAIMENRDLTTLEYVILGVISTEPRSGYSIASTLESGAYRLRAKTSSIYAALKRLEQNRIITGELEEVTETQSRKVFSLTPIGESLLDAWLLEPLSDLELFDEHNLMLVKFIFAEHRLSHEQILAWLDDYAARREVMDMKLRILNDMMKESPSVHQKLVYKSIAFTAALAELMQS